MVGRSNALRNARRDRRKKIYAAGVRWADLVFHVLAHVPVDAPASAFDRAWIAFVAAHASPGGRTLAEDARLIAAAAPSHDALARVQLLAWLWGSAGRAAACSDRTLEELTEDDVDEPAVLRALRESRAAELLRAAAELEAEVVAGLPPPHPLPLTSPVAPWVSRFSVTGVRALRLRGRVYRDEILVGVPCASLGPTAEHVAWQTAHEATVATLHRAVPRAAFQELEHAALVALFEHAQRTGQGEAHARWLAHFANVPPLSPLSPAWREAVQSLSAR